MLREECVYKRDAPKCVRIRLWPFRRDDSSRVLIGAAGMLRSDWRRRNVGALIGQRACRLLALAREAIDSTRAAANGSSQVATTDLSKFAFIYLIHFLNSPELKSFAATSEVTLQLFCMGNLALNLSNLFGPLKSLEGKQKANLAFHFGSQNAHVGSHGKKICHYQDDV